MKWWYGIHLYCDHMVPIFVITIMCSGITWIMSSSLRINIVLCVVTSIFPAREYCGHDWVGAWMRPEQRPSGHQLVTQNYLGWRPRVVARPAFIETDELLSVLYLRELLVLSWFYYFVWWEFSEFFNQVLIIWSVIISLCKSCFINIQLWWGRGGYYIWHNPHLGLVLVGHVTCQLLLDILWWTPTLFHCFLT